MSTNEGRITRIEKNGVLVKIRREVSVVKDTVSLKRLLHHSMISLFHVPCDYLPLS